MKTGLAISRQTATSSLRARSPLLACLATCIAATGAAFAWNEVDVRVNSIANARKAAVAPTGESQGPAIIVLSRDVIESVEVLRQAAEGPEPAAEQARLALHRIQEALR